MATEFTKGPWKVVGYVPHIFKQGDKLFVDGPIDANIDPELDARFSVAVIDGPDAIANARLIAAAPQLLEALKRSRQLASIGYRIGEADMRGHDKVGELYGKQQDELMAVIDAAIARAEGK